MGKRLCAAGEQCSAVLARQLSIIAVRGVCVRERSVDGDGVLHAKVRGCVRDLQRA